MFPRVQERLAAWQRQTGRGWASVSSARTPTSSASGVSKDEERITIADTEALVWGDEGYCTLRFDAWPAADGQVLGADPTAVLATQGHADIASSPLACEFVRPDHALSVRVRTALEPLGSGDETTVAGRAAVEISGNEDQVVTQVALGDGTEPGLLELSVWVTPDRGYGLYTDVPIDRTPLEAVDDLMERLATDLLG